MASTQTFQLERNPLLTLPRTGLVAVSTEWVFFGLFVAGLAWVPYWLGSDRLIPWGINALLFPGLAALYELSLLVRGAPHPVPIRRVWLSAVLLGVVAAWILLQNATWMPVGWHHPIWELASDVLERPLAGSISVDPSLTTIALLRLLTAASVFWLALQLRPRPSAGARIDLVCGGN